MERKMTQFERDKELAIERLFFRRGVILMERKMVQFESDKDLTIEKKLKYANTYSKWSAEAVEQARQFNRLARRKIDEANYLSRRVKGLQSEINQELRKLEKNV